MATKPAEKTDETETKSGTCPVNGCRKKAAVNGLCEDHARSAIGG